MFNDIFKIFSAWMIGLISFVSFLDAAAPEHLTLLRELEEYTQSENTSYVSGGSQISWIKSGQPAACFADSSGLFDALLSHAYGYTPEDFKHWMGLSRPTAYVIYQTIHAGNGFQPIMNITEIKSGDILAICYPHGNGEGDSDWGHIAIVDKSPYYAEQKAPFVEGAQQWIISVIDCALTGHGSKDTRYLGNDTYRSGLGRGNLRVYIDLQGIILGYTWSRSDNSPYFPQNVNPLICGRLDK